MDDSRIYDYDHEEWALCPLTRKTCASNCMLMRPSGFGEPKCSIRVIADELVLLPKKNHFENMMLEMKKLHGQDS